MADQIPLKTVLTNGEPTALGEFNSGDVIPVEHGGTGATSASIARSNLGVPAVAHTHSSDDLTDLETNPLSHAMAGAEFFARMAQRDQIFNGSGFVEMGKTLNGVNTWSVVGEGLSGSLSNPNQLRLGRSSVNGGVGVSRTDHAVVNAAGVVLPLTGSEASDVNLIIKLPPAPDGTVTYDSATGSVVQHASAAEAFAAETATNKVVTDRQDLTFLEVFFEDLATHDLVCVGGATQYGATTYEGIALSNSLIAQGYSAFGTWDTETKGYHARWSTLSFAEKDIFLSDPKNNIYLNKEGKYIQVKFRVRSVAGAGNGEWRSTFTASNTGLTATQTQWLAAQAQGSSVVAAGLTSNSSVDSFQANSPTVTHSWVGSNFQHLSKDAGSFVAVGGNNVAFPHAHQGRCFAIPIALVSRMNQGAYHPEFNSLGCRTWTEPGGNAKPWYYVNNKATSEAACFDVGDYISGTAVPKSSSGFIGSGNGSSHPHGYFYDAIYEWQVHDRRMSALNRPKEEILNEAINKAVSGEMRGVDYQPFTKVHFAAASSTYGLSKHVHNLNSDDGFVVGDTVTVLDASNNILILNATLTDVSSSAISWDGPQDDHQTYSRIESDVYTVVHTRKLPAPLSGLTMPWQDLIGAPENISACFPSGCWGQWIPVIPDGTAKNFPLSRKCLESSAGRVMTGNNGTTWVTGSSVVQNTQNQTDPLGIQATEVALHTYTTPSHCTQPGNNSKVEALGDVWASCGNREWEGVSLASSLTGNIHKAHSPTPRSGWLSLHKKGERIDGTLLSDVAYLPTHSPITIQRDNDSAAAKALMSLTAINGQYHLQFQGCELVWDTGADDVSDAASVDGKTLQSYVAGQLYRITGLEADYVIRCVKSITNTFSIFTPTADGRYLSDGGDVYFQLWNGNGWGDDNTIPIGDGDFTVTDENSNTVKGFCHHTPLPFFSNEHEEA